MAITKKEPAAKEPEISEEVVQEDVQEVVQEVIQEVVVPATDKVLVLNSSSKKVCLTSSILEPGDEGIATRAEFGTLWQFLELAEK